MELEYLVGAESVVLTDYGRLKKGRKGDLGMPVVIETRRVGNELQRSLYLHGKRAVDIPFLAKAASEAALLANLQTMMNVLTSDTLRSDGFDQDTAILQVTKNDASVRQLQRCFYVGGLDEKAWINGMESVISFDALDPYWYDPTAVEVTFSSGETPSMLFFPLPPLYLAPSAVFAEQSVVNPGAEAWPIWTISGPGSSISLINQTTGRKVMWTGTLMIDDELEIDTRPLHKTVRLNGENAWDSVPISYADLWPLAAGPNALMVTIANSTGDTSAVLSYNPRYKSL